MTTLQIIFIIGFCASVIANLLAFWYLRRVLPGLIYTSRNLQDLVTYIQNYRQHIKRVYEMEMYYGDETLKNLLTHTTMLAEVLEEYEDIYLITSPIEDYEDEEINGEQEDGETQINQENVFYAGSRRSNN